MTRTIELRTEEVELVLRAAENEWCQVTLIQAGTALELGADAFSTVMPRLAIGLADSIPGETYRTPDGHACHFVLTLFEHHYTIYAGDVGGSRTWWFEDPDRTMRATIRLSSDDRARWLSLITSSG